MGFEEIDELLEIKPDPQTELEDVAFDKIEPIAKYFFPLAVGLAHFT
jgi:hypothetical protein